MNKKSIYIALLGVCVSGCDTLRHTFGLDHYAADAFNVTENPALCVPPEYNLTPPVPGAAVQGEQAVSLKAQQKLFGNTAKATSGASESHFLNSARQGNTADANIRETVNKESEEEKTVMGKLKNLKDEAVRTLKGDEKE